MKIWLVAKKLASDQNMKHLEAVVTKRVRELNIESSSTEHMGRLLHSAFATYELQFFHEVLQWLPISIRTQLDEVAGTQ